MTGRGLVPGEPGDSARSSSLLSRRAGWTLLDLTVYGRQEVWEDSPDGWPQGPTYGFWRTDGRPTAQWTRPGAAPDDVAFTGRVRRTTRR